MSTLSNFLHDSTDDNDFIPAQVLPKEIPAKSFYGENRVDYATMLGIKNTEVKIFKQFPVQDEAFKYFDTQFSSLNRRKCKILSYESVQSGKRMFLVADMKHFCLEYFKLRPTDRHVYEIIREGYACRAYFDLEFHKQSNLNINGDDLCAKFIDLVNWTIFELYNVAIGPENILILDSTTDDKYSVHVSYQIITTDSNKEKLFANNLQVGCLIKTIVLNVTLPMESFININDNNKVEVYGLVRQPRKGFEDLWVLKKDGKRTFFADLSVYTRNRAFRMLGSCKYSKTQTLQVCRKEFLQVKERKELVERKDLSIGCLQWETLCKSCIVPVDMVSDVQEVPSVTAATSDMQSPSSPMLENVSIPKSPSIPKQSNYILNKDKYDLLPLITITNNFSSHPLTTVSTTSIINTNLTSPNHHQNNKKVKTHHVKDTIIAKSSHSREQSWFPLLDQHITSTAASIGGVTGVLFHWTLFLTTRYTNSDFPILILRYDQVQHNRWCANIGRAHRSNGISIEVDLMNGCWTQSCYDVDCRGSKSPPVSIPYDVLPPFSELNVIVDKYRTPTT